MPPADITSGADRRRSAPVASDALRERTEDADADGRGAGSPDTNGEEVPDRPKLAPDVELSGRMEDSAFEKQPWMVVRKGGFVSVTEVLYHVADHADGRRSLAEIADAVSKITDRSISEDNVRQLVRDRLIPLGLVARADGSVAEVKDESASRSPLHIGMRTAQIPGHVLEPLANGFKFLFAPPILLGVVAIGLVALGWVLLVHGLGQGLRGAVYQPWLILVLLPLVVGSAAFHEFGHAAALAYGGGRVRGMGAGIYTAYPVFFTDVTDNYRLKRWSRVRTDLGGFHFNLVFALGIVGLYLLTGLEFLLLVVLVIVFSIVQQSIPIVRLDGYWALADMTGIPDPLSYVKPFLKSVLPVPAWRDESLPPMKRWAKAVLAIWLLITIPLLLVLGVVMLASAPRVIGTAVDSFFRHAASFGDALGRGDAVTALASIVSIAVLALTSLAFVWFIGKTIRGLLTRLWRWAGDSVRRRAAARALTLAMVGGLVFLWAPPLPFFGTPPGPFHNFTPIAATERLTVLDVLGIGGGSPQAPPQGPAVEPGTNPAPVAPPDVDPPGGVPPVPSAPIDVPGVDAPDIDVPEVDVPVATPEVDVPEVDVPEVDVPEVDVPEVDTPEVTVPPSPPPAVESAIPSPPPVPTRLPEELPSVSP